MAIGNEGQSSSPEWKPEPAESFAIEFTNGEGVNQIKALSLMGFSFRGKQMEGEDVVINGERQNGDGTTIEIRIKKGEKYRTPKELADEEATRLGNNQERN